MLDRIFSRTRTRNRVAAGRTITENRTLTVTYTMQGTTHTATYENTAFTITLPAPCPGS